MKSKFVLLSLLVIMPSGLLITSCDDFFSNMGLTEAEVVEGLKEALVVGTNNSVVLANAENGYFLHQIIKIPFPPEAETARDVMVNHLGLGSLVEQFIMELNRAAEHAAVKAKPIFINAITSITINDAWDILYGENNAATMYLHNRTFSALFTAFAPDITTSLETVGASQTWSTLVGYYNSYANISPIHNPINPDIGEYTTDRALGGLFHLIEVEEEKIRLDPTARINDILQRVFGELD